MSDTYDILAKIMKERIIIIDGAMGTSIQKYKGLTEADFRGEQWKNHTHDLKGDNDCLVVTRPDIIGEIHGGMLEAGADIIETNTFNGTTISQADYELQDLKHVNLINTEAVKLAKRVCAEWTAKTPNKPRFVAGAIGPTNRTLSVSPSVENPAYRNCTYDEVVQAYLEQAEGLYAGGVDLFLVDTIFDSLNAKAAMYALDLFFEKVGKRIPVFISGTIADNSGRTLSGQTSRTCRSAPTASCSATPTRDCRTRWADTTRRAARWRRNAVRSRRAVSSTASADAAARRTSTSSRCTTWCRSTSRARRTTSSL